VGGVDVTKFKAARRRFSDHYREQTMGLAVRKANELADTLANRTPVDTGAAKDSWNASVRDADLRFRDRNAGYHNPLGDPDGERIPDIPGAAPWGSAIHVSNSVPYIRMLNAGSSRQAPAAFVEITIAEFLAGTGR